MAKTVTITDTNGKITEATVSDNETALHFENLPFETDHIAAVTVTERTL